MTDKALDMFRAGSLPPDAFLANRLWRVLEKPKWSEADKAEHVRIAETIVAGKSQSQVEELGRALEWSRTNPHWTYIDCMKYFANKADVILRQYQAETRKAKLLSKQEGPVYSPACQALMKKYPDKLREGIEVTETEARVAAKQAEFRKSCKECKGKEYVTSRHPSVKGVKVFCHACRKYRSSIWYDIQREVHNELYA